MSDPRQSALLRFAAVLAASLAACSDDPAANGADAGPGGTVAPSRVLTRVGPASIEVHPDDVVTLQALLSQKEVGPVADAAVAFTVLKDPTGASQLGQDSVQTDERGVAAVQLTIGPVPSDPMDVIEVKASSEGANGDKAVWHLKVVELARHLEVVPTTDVLVDPRLPAAGAVQSPTNRPVQLKVRVLDDRDRAVADTNVTFRIRQTPPPAGAQLTGDFVADGSGGLPYVVSNMGGEAAATLAVGTVQGTYNVEANFHEGDGEGATFTVKVTSSLPTGCRTSAQCAQGMVCREGMCVTAGPTGGGSCNGNDVPCPMGYKCNTGTGACEPYTEPGNCEQPCDPGTHCDAGSNECVPDECTADSCPECSTCQNGICIPSTDPACNNPTGEQILDVTGHWFTRHEFDVHEALPGWVRTLSQAVRGIDQAIHGQLNLPGWLSWANALIAAVLQGVIPQWAQDLVYLFDSAFTIFSELRSEGEMELVAVGGPRVLSGTEDWTSFIFYFLPQCGGNIGGSLDRPPPCARVDIYTTDLPADLAASVKPFAARLVGSPPATSTIYMDNREVDMKFQGLIKYVIDQLAQMITGEANLADALTAVVPCEDLGSSISDDPLIGGAIASACTALVGAAGRTVENILAGVQTNVRDMLTFNGQATAQPAQYQPAFSDQLGYENFRCRNPADGVWTAKFRTGVGVNVNNVPGRWHATRDPMVEALCQ